MEVNKKAAQSLPRKTLFRITRGPRVAKRHTWRPVVVVVDVPGVMDLLGVGVGVVLLFNEASSLVSMVMRTRLKVTFGTQCGLATFRDINLGMMQ
jgi:hypothetical protein